MRSVFEELYNGNIQPGSRSYSENSSFAQLEELKDKNSAELMRTLDNSEKETFEKYRAAQDELEEITRYDTYTYALKLGILFMAEAFMNGDEMIEC